MFGAGHMGDLPAGFQCDAPPEGFYSEAEQYWTIRPRSEYRYDPESGWLCIGGPGVDGIEFGLRQGQAGVFAYYPITGEYDWKAASVSELIRGWLGGQISI